MNRFTPLLIALLPAVGCAEPARDAAPDDPPPAEQPRLSDRPVPPLDSLLSAPLSVTVDVREATLESELARDFQPPSSGGPVVTAGYVLLSGPGLFPEDLNVHRLWLVHEARVLPLEFKLRGRALPQYPASLTFLAIDGPFWPVGDSVVVVVELIDGDGVTHLLRAPTQAIRKVS